MREVKKPTQITARLPALLRARLIEEASSVGLPYSVLVERALRLYLAELATARRLRTEERAA